MTINNANVDAQMENLETTVLSLVNQSVDITKDLIHKTIEMLKPSFPLLDQEKLDIVQRRIEERCAFTMPIGVQLTEPYQPWLDNKKSSIDWYYWKRYKAHLLGKKFGQKVVNSLDIVSDKILALAENPGKDGTWERKGMVVGNVQSGKTANYIGLISKAADAGYKVFIVIAGTTNSLRKQTQARIEQGFTGYDSSALPEKKPVGVGITDPDLSKRPVTFTTVTRDFNSATARQVGASLQSFKTTPVVFVIKKNSSTLASLVDWLKQSIQSKDEMAKIDDVPMMLIDDEADNASINTKNKPDEASKINSLIRQLLNVFNKKCYIGYTATPFANIFIDDTPIEGIGGDLFPRDFIYCLDAPSNYCGANKIFCKQGVSDFVRIIKDNQDETGENGLLPFKHTKDLPVDELPQSLLSAVDLFVLARAIRILRGDGKKHNSMLVNVSRFNSVQQKVQAKLSEYLTELQNAIRYNYNMKSALKNPTISGMKALFEQEYSSCEFTWSEVQKVLNDAAAPIKVYTINQSSADALDYEKYPDGLNIIAVGGFALSRGLTLEGLSISYLIRNTMMYDTLMQMGRWFGYRDGYEDLCRIYMPEESLSWYEFITDATDELIADFKYMASLDATPKNFGLRVRKSPFNLLITAKNKMWHGTPVKEKVDLSGRYIETKRILITKEDIEHNQQVFFRTIERLQEKKTLTEPNHSQGYLWQDVPADEILDFIRDYRNHDGSIETQMPSVHRFILHTKDVDQLNNWDVALISIVNKPTSDNIPRALPIDKGITVVQPWRKGGKITFDGKGIEVGSRRRMASQGIEKIGLTQDQIDLAEQDMQQSTDKDLDKAYRKRRSKPLLILFLARIGTKDGTTVYDLSPVYGISFPFIERDYVYEGEEYVVNTQWIRENFGIMENEEEDEYENN